MQTSNRFLDDLAKVANSAVSTVGGIKGEVEAIVRQRLDRLLGDMDLVARDEFEAVKAMAAKARLAQEKLEVRVAELEAQLVKKAAPRAKKKPPSSARKAPPAK